MSNAFDIFDTIVNPFEQFDNPARPRAAGATNANPQAAAKSVDISKQSGVPFELVNTDPQRAEEDLKLRQTNAAIDHPAIAAYVTSYTPAAEISNDDYPNLAKIADTTKAFSLPTILDRTVTGFQQGFKTQEPLVFTPEEIAKYPLTYRTWQPFAAPIAALFRLPGGVIGAASAALSETYEQLGGDRPWAMRLERDLNILGLGLITESAMGARPVEPSPIAKEYLQNGRVPGIGVDPVVDAARSVQAHTDAASLDKAVSEAQKSNTLSRSPDAFEEFAKNATQQTISIPAEALAKIYESDPEKLSWVPDIERQISDALETGGDVEISLASYLAKGKDIHEGLRDDVRVRQEGLTVNEAKNFIEVYHGSPHEFEAFNIEKIGTGEGAQSYGHGLYFAEEATVAREYQERLGVGTAPTDQTALMYLQRTNWNKDAAKARVLNDIGNLTEAPGVRAVLEAIDKAKVGNLYKARINVSKENFLDWDKPLGEQNTQIQKALKKAMGDKAWEQFKSADASTAVRQGFIAFTDEEVARKLSEVDIPGIKYLDRDSRGAGEGTRNFVLFDDKLIQILEKNGEPVQNATRVAAVAEESALGLRTLFKDATAAGMTEAQFNAYSKKVQRQVEAIEDRATTLSEREVRERQTEEWKRNETEIKAQVEAELRDQPIHVADREIRADKRLGTVDPDVLAPVFGFNSGEAMIRNLELLNNARNVAKQTPLQYFRDLVSKETTRRMEAKYGNLAENIFAEARDLALADLHIDIMDSELRTLTEQAKGEPPLSREELRDWVRENHGEADLKSASQFEKFQRQAWKNSREAEQALLKGDYILAAKAKQRQLLSFMLAQEAQRLQKEMASAEKLFDKFSKREVAGVDQAFTDRVHQILQMIDPSWPSNQASRLTRDPRELAEAISKQSLEEFVNQWEGNYREVPIADFLLDGTFRAPLETVSTDQFRAIHDSIKSLAHNGKELKSIANAEARAALDDVVTRAVTALSRFNPVNQPLNPGKRQQAAALGRWVLAVHMLPERILDYTDKFDPHGPFNAFVDRPLREGTNKELALTEEVTTKLRALRDDKANLYENIPNNLIPDYYSNSGFLNLNRQNLRHIMLNMGNRGKRSNLEKLTQGFGIEEAPLWDFVHQHATKADWDWVQGMWDIFEHLKGESDAMYERLSGVAPTKVRASEIETPFGRYKGGYAPLIYDPIRSTIGTVLAKDVLEEPFYFRATTPNSYTKARTDYKGALDISGVSLDRKMYQMVHDIAFREAVINANKLLSHPEVRAAMTKHWGKQYTDLFEPWLKDIANVRNADDDYAVGAAYWSRVMRQNVISTLTSVNPGTVTKHGLSALALSMEEVGVKNFLQALGDITSTVGRADSQWAFILENSPFMRNRMQKYVETIQGAYMEATGKGIDLTRPSTWRQPIMYYGRSPIMLGDALSSLPTWLASYNKAIAAGETTETAIFMSDKAVSRAHGSLSLVDKPRVLRTGETLRWFTGLYNFFNHIVNKQVQLAWDVKSSFGKRWQGEALDKNETVSSITNRLMAHVIIPTMVEEWVTAWFDDNEQKRGFGARAASAIVRQLGAGIVGIREITHAWTTGGPAGRSHEPSTGMLSTLSKDSWKALEDLRLKVQKGEPSKDWISHIGTALGFFTGTMGAQPAKAIQFGQKVATGQERPQTPYQVLKGLRKGSIRERRH